MTKDEQSYRLHEENVNKIMPQVEERLYYAKNKESLGYQTQEQVLDRLAPFLAKQSKWLTIGDLQGTEANYLLTKGQDVTASDITDIFLKEAEKANLIKDFEQVNVEKIQFEDNSFDYVFCKEAYHHFPKAYVGLHEMIRCSAKATIIIEPIDILGKMPTLLFVKNILDRIDPLLINKVWKKRFSFETVGNYVYKVSEREMEKIAMGLAMPYIAYKRMNIILTPGLSEEVLRELPMNQKGWKKVQNKIKLQNVLSKLHLIPYNHICCVLFKETPSPEVLADMKKEGYSIMQLPKNPYMND